MRHQEKWGHNKADVKNEPNQGNHGILFGGLIQRDNPMEDGKPEPFPTKKPVDEFILLPAQLEKQDDSNHHPAEKYPKSHPE
jgi:hypothetical protein